MRKKKLFTRRNILSLSISALAANLAATQNPFKQNVQALEFDNNSLKKRAPKKKKVRMQSGTYLRQIAAEKGLIYGCFPSMWYEGLAYDQQFESRLIQECGLLVAGVYHGFVSLEEDHFDFSDTDNYANFAQQNNMLFRGHPLLWHDYNAEWLTNKFKNSNTSSEEIEKILINHISTIVNRYAGQAHSWDVVNELVNVSDGRADGLRDTLISGIGANQDKYRTWLHFLGSDYIDLAFRTAAKADPQALLVYNENALEYDGPVNDAKRQAVLNLLQILKSRGTPIHAFGIQAHLFGSSNKYFNATKFRQFLSDVASLGLKILITELDVIDQDLPQDISTRDRLVAECYENFLSVALDEPATIAVITWGLSDRYTWISNFAPRADGASVRPLPLDDKMQPKKAWNAIATAFKQASHRPNRT